MLQAYIEDVMHKVCNYLPHILTDRCTDIVKYSKKLVKMLPYMSPLKICIYLHLCDRLKDPGPKRNNIAEKNGEICKLFLKVYI